MTDAREDMLAVTMRLVSEHEHLAAGSVIRCVARCREELLRLGLRDGLLDALEAMARRRLRERARDIGQQLTAATSLAV